MEQVVVIFAGVRGYLDVLDVGQIGQFEEHLLKDIRANHGQLLEAIRQEGEISEGTEEQLKAAIEAASESFSK